MNRRVLSDTSDRGVRPTDKFTGRVRLSIAQQEVIKRRLLTGISAETETEPDDK